ncbi:trigger factor-like [Teleopsis dalmanni]|uniref:trigger factor-like n=1 Tax=Teleopsis dalmanni TaxID=139649 RepID=UPI0018CE162F|nr:trigger factor-like [Teleopsis dalmanni]
MEVKPKFQSVSEVRHIFTLAMVNTLFEWGYYSDKNTYITTLYEDLNKLCEEFQNGECFCCVWLFIFYVRLLEDMADELSIPYSTMPIEVTEWALNNLDEAICRCEVKSDDDTSTESEDIDDDDIDEYAGIDESDNDDYDDDDDDCDEFDEEDEEDEESVEEVEDESEDD